MAPAASPSERECERVGPHPSYIEIAKPYMLQSRMQKCLSEISMTDAKEDAVRLQGVAWIDQVRRALQLPIRTFNTAVIYYHKFRLLHADHEYNWADAAAAALFTACKIEDTLKKSKEILCAHWNLKVGSGESLSSDDPRFENHSKLIIGLERLMLESAGFDFRNRYPQKLMVKLARALKFGANTEAKTLWNLSVDIYRTFAPLKQSTPTMAIACLELAARLHGKDIAKFVDAGPVRYSKWATSRAEVMETLLDLLDLFTHHRSATSVGSLYTLEHFINIRIGLNQEASAANIPRYSQYASESASDSKPRNGIDPTSPLTPATPGTLSPGTDQALKSAIGIRGQNGTVRFMLDAARAHDERTEVDKFHKVEEEEYEVEVPNDTRPDDRERERVKVGRVTSSIDNSLPGLPVADTVVPPEEKNTERPGNYWEMFRQRRAGISHSQPAPPLQGQPTAARQSQNTEASQSHPTFEVNDFVHPSRKAANFDTAVGKPENVIRPGRDFREAGKTDLIRFDGLGPLADKIIALSSGDADHVRAVVDRSGRTLFRGTDMNGGSYRGSNYVSRERGGMFKKPSRRSPPRAGERGFAPESMHQRAYSRDTKEAQGEAPQATGYIHPSRMALVSPAPEPARDSRPQERNKIERPPAQDVSRTRPDAERMSGLTAADGHQWANTGNDDTRGRGRGCGRGGYQRGRGRGRGFAEVDRSVPPTPSWSDPQFDPVYRRR